MEIGLLGAVTVMRGETPIEVGGARAETLLALLAMQPGTPVSPDVLVDELWAGEPSDGAHVTLRSYVSRLRDVLGEGAPIVRATAGYTLAVAPDAVDLVRFEAGIRDGVALLGRGRHRRAAEVLRAALGLWRGRPFAGLAEDGALRTETARLEELRLGALEARFEAELELGMDAELVDELEALVAEHPFRERLWRHLMLGLYRAGRQADALAAFHRARAALDEQLGVDPGDELQALEAGILRHDVPAPAGRATGTVQRLPAPLTTFVGRERELGEVRHLLQRSRLVTLVGVGGVGKTRVALEGARRAAGDLVDLVAFVDLAAISDEGLVLSQVAAAFGVREGPGETQLAAIERHLGTADVLLVLDNCEHVRAATASIARDLLQAAPELRILATSREILDVAGEAAYPLPPLALPAHGDEDAARDSEAVRLLLDRATLTRHDLRVDDDAYAVAADICRELDGLPLAIELAAARTKALSLQEIAARLHDRFQFLVSWRRLTAARHRTLREAMDWSYELLEPEEQRLLVQCSVFAGGATLASIAQVCLDGDVAAAERLVERLVDASLLTPVNASTGTRYRLLETVRQYAEEHIPKDAREGLRRRHAERVLSMARETHLALEGTGASMSYDLARDELPSIRAAIRWATDTDPDLGLEIACALERYWVTNEAREGRDIFAALLSRDGIGEALRARGLRCRGGCRYILAEFDGATEDYLEALAIHRRLSQHRFVAHLLTRLAIEAYRLGDRGRVRQLLEEAESVGGVDRFVADAYVTLHQRADLAFDDGRDEEAFELLRRGVDLTIAAADDWWTCDLLMATADRALDRGRLDDAGPAAREALRLSLRIGEIRSTIWCLATLAREATLRGLPRRAGRLWGGLEAEVDRRGPLGQWERLRDIFRTQVVTADAAFGTGVAEGRSMLLPEVAALALSED